MFAADEGNVSVVVELDEVGSPPDDDGEAGAETDADGDAEALRPEVGGTEGCGGPVEGPQGGAHDAALMEYLFGDRG